MILRYLSSTVCVGALTVRFRGSFLVSASGSFLPSADELTPLLFIFARSRGVTSTTTRLVSSVSAESSTTSICVSVKRVVVDPQLQVSAPVPVTETTKPVISAARLLSHLSVSSSRGEQSFQVCCSGNVTGRWYAVAIFEPVLGFCRRRFCTTCCSAILSVDLQVLLRWRGEHSD